MLLHLQRAILQLKAQRQLEEAFETRLQHIQNNQQVPPYTTPSSDTNLSSSKSFTLSALYFSLVHVKWPQTPLRVDV